MSKRDSGVRLTGCSSTREPVVKRDPICGPGTLPPSLLRKVRSTATWALVWAGISVGACMDGTGIAEPPTATSWPGVVSDPVAVGSPGSSTLRSTSGTDLVYISLAPGTIPGGELASIRNRVTGSGVVAGMVAGGLDPVPVAAVTGDTLDIEVRLAGSDSSLSFIHVVPAARPPIVVRTEPPPRKRDVPLNVVIVIVFSEPIDPATLTDASVQLLQGATLVPGRLEFRDPANLTAAFAPATALAASTDYRLNITQGIRDLDGEALEVAVMFEFTTESGAAPVASVTVDQPVVTLAPGEAITLTATPYDSVGQALTGRVVSWSIADATVATVSTGGTISAASIGTTSVTATVEGQSAVATINVAQLVFATVTTGDNYSCGLTIGGAAYCWGGQLGSGSNAPSTTPVPVTGGLSFASLSAGFAHTCGITTGGAAYCWGVNYSGGLGDGSTTASATPVAVLGGQRFVQITAGISPYFGEHTCGLTDGGAAYCWGDGHLGQLGNGRGDTDTSAYSGSLTPVAVSGGLTFMSLSAGLDHTCGLTGDGTAYCWGNLSWGALPGWPGAAAAQVCVISKGEFYTRCFTQPVLVSSDLTFKALSSGSLGECGLTDGGVAYCWGDDYPSADTWPLLAVPGGSPFAAVTKGRDRGFACGVSTAGAASCWGTVSTGGGSDWVGTEWVVEPRMVLGGHTFVSLGLGWSHACGITPGGVIYCWGHNGAGQLGNGSQEPFSPVPVKVAGQQ